MIYKPEEELYALVRSVLLAAGADQENAVAVAAHLVRANLSGVDSHGVWHLCRYVEEIQEGAIVPAAHSEILRETPGSALISGNWGFGHPVGAYAMEVAIAKAAQQGMAVTSVVQKHHIGRLGHYVELAAERGMIGMALAAGQGVADPAAVPYGGAENLLHTNPLAVAFPTGVADRPLMFDFATSATSGVKVANAQRRGEKVAHGYIVDRHGSPTDDPRDFFAGGGHAPFGGHKGYAIMLMVEYLGRIFSGADSFADERRGGIVRHEGGHHDRDQGRPVSAPGPVRGAVGGVRAAHPRGAAGARVRRGAGPRRPGGAHPRSAPPGRDPDRGRRVADGGGGRGAGRRDGELSLPGSGRGSANVGARYRLPTVPITS